VFEKLKSIMSEKFNSEEIKFEQELDADSFSLTITFRQPVNLINGDKIIINYEDLIPILVTLR